MTLRHRAIVWTLGPVALLAATTALAQTPGDVRRGANRPAVRKGAGPPPASSTVDRRPRGAVTPVLLIGLPAVQAELKLSDAEKNAIRDMNAEFDKRRRETADRLMKAPKGLDQGALMAMIADLRSENEQALKRVLNKRQRERLAQVSLQLEGPLAVTRPEIARELNFDELQEQQVEALKHEYDALREQVFTRLEARYRQTAGARGARPAVEAGKRPIAAGAPGGTTARVQDQDVERVRRELADLRTRFVREVGKVLTRRQKATFDRMLGEPFDLAKVQFRGSQSGPVSLPHADAPDFLEPVAPLNTPAPAAAGSEKRSGEPPGGA